jgi:NAD(P)-dependent dehydrogenase (short-subunit alcohol dehydrogenase family)
MLRAILVFLSLWVLDGIAGFIIPPTIHFETKSRPHFHEATASNFAETFLSSQQPKGISAKTLKDMIQRQQIREKFVVVITGATGGIGSSICQTVLALNGLVVAVDFDKQALINFKSRNPERIRTVFSDFKDMNSVSKAADSIIEQVAQIDILVCNAGICYLVDDDHVDEVGCTEQGYDDCFQINYLSHFLFTKKLLKKMNPSTGRLVHVTSGLSWSVDGSGLIPFRDGDPPASRSGSDRLPRHVSMAYGNSKLAQIWHAAHLNRLDSSVTAVCACPSWAATGIAGKNTDAMELLEKLAFPTYPQSGSEEIAGPGIRSILNAMFLPSDELDADLLSGKKLLGNSRVLDFVFPQDNENINPILSLDLVGYLGREKVIKTISIFAVLIFQRWTHGSILLQNNSYEAMNRSGQLALYEWSGEVVSQWVKAAPGTIEENINQQEGAGGEEQILLV